MLDREQLDKVIERNPRVDPRAIERSKEIAEKLAALGIPSSGYRLEPALGGRILKNEQREARLRSQQTK